MNLTRAKFDELTHELIERTAIPVQNALRDAGISASELNKVLLVGGSTRMISAQEKVRQLTGKEPNKSLNPDECVSLGAAIQGGKLAGETGTGDILLLDVTPLSLSIETMGGVATRLIERNTTIPAKKSQVFSTAEDNQTAVDIHVVQGERQFVKDNKTLGRFRLDGILPAKRGIPQIEVTFDIDANGIVNVSAKDLGTGKEQHITITSGSNMSDTDIDRAVKEAEMFAAADKEKKETIENYNAAQSVVTNIEQNMRDLDGKISTSDKNMLNEKISAIKDIVEHHDIQSVTPEMGRDLKTKSDDLLETAQRIFSSVYENTDAAKPDNQNIDETGHDDNIVDGEFQEI